MKKSLRHIDQRRRHTLGFTLVEVLVVMTLLVIVLGVSIPQYTRFLSESNTGATARRFAGEAMYLRNLAAKKGRIFYVEINFEENSYTVLVRKPLVELELPEDLDYRDEDEYRQALEDALYEEYSDDFVGQSRLKSNVFFLDVVTADGTVVTDDGDEPLRLLFYPNGSADKATVHFINPKGNMYTVEIRPLTARPRVFDFYSDPAEEIVLDFEDDVDDEEYED